MNNIPTTPSALSRSTSADTSQKTTANNSSQPSSPTRSTTVSATSSSTANNATTLQALSHQLKTAVQVTATVKSSQVLNAKNQEVLSKVNPELANKLQNQTAAITGRSNANTSQNTNNPLNNSTLYLVKLSLPVSAQQVAQSVKTPTNILTTITPVAYKAGDTLQLQLNSQQNIIIKPALNSVRPALIDGLKKALPQQQQSNPLLNTLNQLNQLPSGLKNNLIPPNTQTAIKQLSAFIQSQQTLASGTQVKNALANSGVFTEQKIQTLQGISGDLRTALGALQQSLELVKTGMAAQSAAQPKGSTSLGFTPSIETAIAQLLSSLNTNSPTSTNANKINTQQITAFMQLLGLKVNPNPAENNKKVRDVLSKQLQQMVQSAQEKIHMNQLRSISADNSGAEQAIGKNPTITTEIPLRWGESVLPLQITIEEKPQKHAEQESNTENDGEHQLTRRWQVFMSFDLPHSNRKSSDTSVIQLHTQLTVVQDTVSVTLWTESHVLCNIAKQQLNGLRQQLIANGLNVEDLCCIEGKPPSQELSLDYNLIDIVT